MVGGLLSLATGGDGILRGRELSQAAHSILQALHARVQVGVASTDPTRRHGLECRVPKCLKP